jgi:predicted RNase H-like nuclease
MYVGVDGCPDGWVAVAYAEGFGHARFYPTIDALWERYRDAERILVDVPIGLRRASSEPRACDSEARNRLSPHRHHSVFPTPIRAAAHENSYETAKATQEARTDGSLNRQSWGIAPKIAEVDGLLRATPAARERIRESHPELCFWAFAGRPMRYSKTADPRRAYWERVGVLREREPAVYDHLWAAAEHLEDGNISTDDLIDAFVVALTARGDNAGLRTVPETPEHDDEGLPMEIVYREGAE